MKNIYIFVLFFCLILHRLLNRLRKIVREGPNGQILVDLVNKKRGKSKDDCTFVFFFFGILFNSILLCVLIELCATP